MKPNAAMASMRSAFARSIVQRSGSEAAASSEQLLGDPRVRCPPSAAAATADRAADRAIAGESGPGGGAGVGAAIVAGHDLDILMPRAAVAVFVLDAGIREVDVPIVVRQVVFPRPACNLFGLPVRPAVAVLLASIALVQEALIVALQLVVEDDAPDSAALARAGAPRRAGRRDRPWCRASARAAF